MKRPAVFFDRDNTLIVSDGYLGDPSKVVLVDGAADAVARARTLGYAVVTFSNQSGVARGMFGEDDVRAVNARMDELLKAVNPKAHIDRHEYCPDHPDATVEQYRKETDRRKPGAGMIRCAADAMAMDLSRSWVVGDAPRDIESGAAAGCRTILFDDPQLPRSPAADAMSGSKPDFQVHTLRAAPDIIEREQRITRAQPDPVADAEPPSREQDPPARPTETRNPRTLESVAEQILQELKRRHELPKTDFSVSKLLAGIAQVVSMAMVFIAYLNRTEYTSTLQLLFAIWLQALTIALLIMGRQQT